MLTTITAPMIKDSIEVFLCVLLKDGVIIAKTTTMSVAGAKTWAAQFVKGN